jgi:hypothetical protein
MGKEESIGLALTIEPKRIRVYESQWPLTDFNKSSRIDCGKELPFKSKWNSDCIMRSRVIGSTSMNNKQTA